MIKPRICNRYNHDKPVSKNGDAPSMTEQQFKDECDINSILNRARIGQPPDVKPVSYGDFSSYGDFHENLQRIEKAKSDFSALPSAIRDRFGNSPESFMQFVLDPKNVEECVKLGIMVINEPVDTPVDVLKRIEEKVTSKDATVAS